MSWMNVRLTEIQLVQIMTSKKQYQKDKEIREMYRNDLNTTDPYSVFKEKIRKTKNPF